MPAKTRHCGHCGARVQANDTHCMDCGRELLPSTPPQAEAAPPSPPQPTIAMSQEPLSLPPSVESEASADSLVSWGRAISTLYAISGIVTMGLAFSFGSSGQGELAIGIAGAGIGQIIAGAWLQSLHNAAAVNLRMLGRQTEALEALARRTQ